MLAVEVPVLDAGTGQPIARKITIVGATAHIGDESTPPMFRLYLAEIAPSGRLLPIGVDGIPLEYLRDFTDQLKRLLSVLLAGGNRDWAGSRIDFESAKLLEDWSS